MHPARLCGGFWTIFFCLVFWSPCKNVKKIKIKFAKLKQAQFITADWWNKFTSVVKVTIINTGQKKMEKHFADRAKNCHITLR